MARGPAKLSRKHREAAFLLGCGERPSHVAAKIGVDPSAITRWRQRADFEELVVEAANRLIAQTAGKAAKLLDKQLDMALESDEINRGWLGQGAAGRVLQRLDVIQQRATQTQSAVYFTDMPKPTMPEPDEEDCS